MVTNLVLSDPGRLFDFMSAAKFLTDSKAHSRRTNTWRKPCEVVHEQVWNPMVLRELSTDNLFSGQRLAT